MKKDRYYTETAENLSIMPLIDGIDKASLMAVTGYAYDSAGSY